MDIEYSHIPVLLEEVISGLDIKPDGIYVDCTIGGGGHSSQILQRLSKTGHLYGFDRDADAIATCRDRLSQFENLTIIHSDYRQATDRLREMGVSKVDGVLIDLGVSSYQLDSTERGFSIMHDGRLDMRFDRDQTLDAFTVVNSYPREKLIDILQKYGEEWNARKIVDNIIAARQTAAIETTGQLKEIIEKSFPKSAIYGKGGLSKKTFQAIRIEVNRELEGLDQALEKLIDLLASGGRMAVITFHSLEDRIVRNIFKKECTDCICPPRTPVCICGHKAKIKLVNKKPITASSQELAKNSRSSSAKLRIVEKL